MKLFLNVLLVFAVSAVGLSTMMSTAEAQFYSQACYVTEVVEHPEFDRVVFRCATPTNYNGNSVEYWSVSDTKASNAAVQANILSLATAAFLSGRPLYIYPADLLPGANPWCAPAWCRYIKSMNLKKQ